MNLAITIARWFLAKYPQYAAMALQQHRVRKERALIKRVAREMRSSMGLPPVAGLK